MPITMWFVFVLAILILLSIVLLIFWRKKITHRTSKKHSIFSDVNSATIIYPSRPKRKKGSNKKNYYRYR